MGARIASEQSLQTVSLRHLRHPVQIRRCLSCVQYTNTSRLASQHLSLLVLQIFLTLISGTIVQVGMTSCIACCIRLTACTTPTAHAIASYPDTSSDIHLSLSTLILQTCRAWLKQLRQAPKHVSNTDHDASKALAHRTVDVRLVQLV